MKVEFNIDKKIVGVIVVVAIIAVFAVAYMGGLFGRPVVYGSEREASEAITNMSTSVEQIESIIDDIDEKLGT